MDFAPPTQELPRVEPDGLGLAQPVDAGSPPIPLVSGSREQCSACGAPLAADQRYCVECGQRRSGARPSFLAQSPPSSASPSSTSDGGVRPRRPLLSINATLLAGIGTLLLAMGIGILIGRSSQGASKTPAVQLLAAPGTAGTGAAGASTGAAGSEAAVPAVPGSTSGAAAKSGGSGGAPPKAIPPKSRPPAPKAVKLGAKGSGAGYQKGKFTGNFFGEEEK